MGLNRCFSRLIFEGAAGPGSSRRWGKSGAFLFIRPSAIRKMRLEICQSTIGQAQRNLPLAYRFARFEAILQAIFSGKR
jgi:hypothetical protein